MSHDWRLFLDDHIRIDSDILWDAVQNQAAELESAVAAFLKA
jgi:hypothetical protein